ncbi:MAG: ATP-dependent RNA helicase [Treponema sp.]|nr:ATP-dependent RNA helicase [Treponema sp.]
MLQSLPITPHLDAICNALKQSNSHFLVLTAETGAGKSTAVPIALLQHFQHNIVMLEPRRIAVLAVAARVSELLGQETGNTAGYVMHLEKNISKDTRFTVMTESILTRMIQKDPALEGIDVVVIDEFHERSIHADLALAFLKEAMSLRSDLFVIVMSATIDAQGIAAYLGTKESPAPIYSVPGKMYPVSIEYQGHATAAEAVLKELHSSESQAPRRGSILVFLPGIQDIRRTEQELRQSIPDAYIQILHSSISIQEQRKVLAPAEQNGRRRIILSSAIAETSLTVPDVTVVIDSGLSRINRMNIDCGMETLVTETESRFSAQQRMGRAGRTQPGHCIRLWKEHDVLPDRTPPEILRTDLTALVLECAQWGITDRLALDWLDAPPVNAWNGSVALLEQLGCLKDKKITQKGSDVLNLPLHPRLACTALADNGSGTALQSVLHYSNYKTAAPAIQKRFLNNLKDRLKNCHSYPSEMPLLAGFPDRIAKKLNTENAAEALYQFPSGRMAQLSKTEQPPYPQWIIAPEADAGERTGRIFQWEAISEEQAASFLQAHSHTETKSECAANSLKLKKTQYTMYGKIILAEKNVPATQADFVQAVCASVKANGIEWLPLSDKTKLFLLRSEFYIQHSHSGIPLPLADYVTSHVEEWLVPFITSQTISEQDIFQALHYFLDGATVDINVPERLNVENGKSFKMSYEKNADSGVITPVLEVIIQQIFGCMKTPKVMGVPVLLKLLSPARRPLQITEDLAGFWNGTWNDICKEMKGRYPKHNWNYKVATD